MRVLRRARIGRTVNRYPSLWRTWLPHLWLEWQWQPRDLFVGVYFEHNLEANWAYAIDVYVCVLPTLPLKIMYRHAGVERAWFETKCRVRELVRNTD